MTVIVSFKNKFKHPEIDFIWEKLEEKARRNEKQFSSSLEKGKTNEIFIINSQT